MAMEWLLILHLIAGHNGGITTERFKTEPECLRIAQRIVDKWYGGWGDGRKYYECVPVEKLEPQK